ncbi:hypothetical protein P170DRAFT_470240 [Aspergillus steynii IBT 23096]|uniref:Uncharacterized protein n=1 Tax=Aspergillus steynii IBT 23096 TaxID=1392250 RepID=A0A2I2GPJ9_9EURO|nr:uncharacterized protein P170DRAFT_470240 [Aspergillus steynii IBT 23096]PLB54798.1 hypothetical protein P170DRAFT_470240 [Aspergillus steynii IBT 23096]
MPSIKPTLHPLKTPQPMVFPSELQRNPDTGTSLSGNGSGRPGDEPLCTPITPPAAYTEFLKAFTPIFSPDSARGENGRFRFDKPFERSAITNANHYLNPPSATSNPGSGSGNTSAPTSQPASAVSTSFNFNESARSATASLPPPTPYGAPFPRRDPRNLRSLRIPGSGPIPPRYSPTSMSMGESPRSATMLRSPYSPSDWKMRYYEGPRSANSRVSVRHVVTHTVTYKRTQLEDPPKGKKRRKVTEEVTEKETTKSGDEEDEDASSEDSEEA